jgi:poly(3-hydroxybutyrate) depolymerase
MATLPITALLDRQRISVSGLSAGAFMAHQLHVAFSDLFCGAGLIAGGPFLSSNNSLWGALLHGLHGMPAPDAHQLSVRTRTLAHLGQIAPVEHLADARVWVFHGKQDALVKRSVVDALVLFYSEFVKSTEMAYVVHVDVGHAMPTDSFGSTGAGKPESPYMVNCGYDAAGELLAHIHGPLKAKQAVVAGSLQAFDQRPFLSRHANLSMDDTGFMYVPRAAREGRPCGVHVALHGCKQHRAEIGSTFAEHAGYNEWAEANDLIVLYPQASATQSFSAFNPAGSWDWWSYTGADYALRSSAQMSSIVAMIQALDIS